MHTSEFRRTVNKVQEDISFQRYWSPVSFQPSIHAAKCNVGYFWSKVTLFLWIREWLCFTSSLWSTVTESEEDLILVTSLHITELSVFGLTVASVAGTFLFCSFLSCLWAATSMCQYVKYIINVQNLEVSLTVRPTKYQHESWLVKHSPLHGYVLFTPLNRSLLTFGMPNFCC